MFGGKGRDEVFVWRVAAAKHGVWSSKVVVGEGSHMWRSQQVVVEPRQLDLTHPAVGLVPLRIVQSGSVVVAQLIADSVAHTRYTAEGTSVPWYDKLFSVSTVKNANWEPQAASMAVKRRLRMNKTISE